MAPSREAVARSRDPGPSGFAPSVSANARTLAALSATSRGRIDDASCRTPIPIDRSSATSPKYIPRSSWKSWAALLRATDAHEPAPELSWSKLRHVAQEAVPDTVPHSLLLVALPTAVCDGCNSDGRAGPFVGPQSDGRAAEAMPAERWTAGWSSWDVGVRIWRAFTGADRHELGWVGMAGLPDMSTAWPQCDAKRFGTCSEGSSRGPEELGRSWVCVDEPWVVGKSGTGREETRRCRD